MSTAIGQCCDTKHTCASIAAADTSASAAKLQHHGCRLRGEMSSACYSCGKLGHTVKFYRNKRQICGGDGIGDREKDFVEESQ